MPESVRPFPASNGSAVALFTENGKDIGYLPRDVAEEIAPRLEVHISTIISSPAAGGA